MTKRILQPERLRQIPSQFSWVDHRLVRSNYLMRASATAWALYLVLVTVGDEHGLSYYSDRTLQRLLRLNQHQLEQARQTLIQAEVIAYEAPLYQVLQLEGTSGKETQP
jgi:hypothetical protein